MAAAPLILAPRAPVMAMEGFSGGDPAPTPALLGVMTQSGELRFVLLNGPGARRPGGAGDRTGWVQVNCTFVDLGAYGEPSSILRGRLVYL
jgi:hypothetical protein